MYARPIRPDEMYKIDLINSVAFESPWETPKPDGKEGEPGPMRWWISGEGDDFYGCIGVLPAQVRFDGHIVGMSGVGGVATLPQYRRRGAIRACMNAALSDMRARGDVFSVLYPFSRAYYRQFGYGDGASVLAWTIPFTALSLPDAGGSVELLLPGSDLAPVREVYDACAKNWNLSFMEPHFLPKGEWMKNKRYLYLWRDENGTPAGAMAFTKADGVMDCRMEFGKENFLLFRDVRALTALLRFAKGFAADYRAIRFAVPQNVRVQSLIAEGNHAACEAYYNCMARLVNVPRALELCRTSAGGSLTIAVTDEILPENGGTWRVDFNPDGPNAVTGTEAAPDIELSVSDLTQLLIGACTAADLPMMPGCTVRNPSAPFDKIFIPKASHILDLF